MTGQDEISSRWHSRARKLLDRKPEGRCFIDGDYRTTHEGRSFPAISPLDGRTIASVAACGAVEVDLAVRAARAAFKDGRWRDLPPSRRKDILFRLSQLVLEHGEELALLETLDMGKPISDSLGVDIAATARCFRWYAEAIDKVYGEVAPTAAEHLATITREPLGVVAAVVPWNFPLIMEIGRAHV